MMDRFSVPRGVPIGGEAYYGGDLMESYAGMDLRTANAAVRPAGLAVRPATARAPLMPMMLIMTTAIAGTGRTRVP